jgi:hypothetical protein
MNLSGVVIGHDARRRKVGWTGIHIASEKKRENDRPSWNGKPKYELGHVQAIPGTAATQPPYPGPVVTFALIQK